MRIGDIQTKKIIRSGSAFSKALEQEWLELLGYSEEEIKADELEICFMASYSKKHDQKFIGIYKPKK